MNGAREAVGRRSAARFDAAPGKRLRTLLSLMLAAVVALPAASALAQDGGGGLNPLSPKLSIGGEQKRKLTPEEEERQKHIDADYRAATSKIPTQKAPDPWADVRQPANSGQKTSSSAQNTSVQKKKPAAQRTQ